MFNGKHPIYSTEISGSINLSAARASASMFRFGWNFENNSGISNSTEYSYCGIYMFKHSWYGMVCLVCMLYLCTAVKMIINHRMNAKYLCCLSLSHVAHGVTMNSTAYQDNNQKIVALILPPSSSSSPSPPLCYHSFRSSSKLLVSFSFPFFVFVHSVLWPKYPIWMIEIGQASERTSPTQRWMIYCVVWILCWKWKRYMR